MKPSDDDIRTFLKSFEELAQSEATIRFSHSGMGRYTEEEIGKIGPINRKVIGWIESFLTLPTKEATHERPDK